MRVKILILLSVLHLNSKADEGMWLPHLISEGIIDSMQAKGFKLSANDIYAVNQASLKDAVVVFGGGCTGGFISDQGLLLTNHHCGLSSINKLSSLENDYVTNGFWAYDQSQELPVDGLSIQILEKVIDVTDKYMPIINMPFTEKDRRFKIDSLTHVVIEQEELDSNLVGVVESFFEQENFYMFIYKKFTDIRLVAAPPLSIGKFGAEEDNWVWPRHTGDFSLFRVYANTSNEPALFSDLNTPFKPKSHLSISTQGYSEEDFTLILGFPGHTDQYISSVELEYITDELLPQLVEIRDVRLAAIDRVMQQGTQQKLMYYPQYSRIANAWKKWQGITWGLNQTNAIEIKRQEEFEMQKMFGDEFNDVYNGISNNLSAYKKYNNARNNNREIILSIDVFELAFSFRKLLNGMGDYDKTIEELRKKVEGFNFDSNPESMVIDELLNNYINNVNYDLLPESIVSYKGSVQDYVLLLKEKSIFFNQDRLTKFFEYPKKKQKKILEKDLIAQLISEISLIHWEQISPNYEYYRNRIDSLNRRYFNMYSKISDGIYPDANFTPRVTFGAVKGYSPSDAKYYRYFTTTKGILEKWQTGNIDYYPDDKLKSLIEMGDYGSFFNAETPVCFIASNHTSGGNSGSPVLNKNGQLTGLNFDRTWESTMSDYHYDIQRCRNISVDIRYILFIIEKYGEATNLIEELTIID